MPSGADILFFLQDSQFRFWSLDSTGAVALSAQPYALVYSPDGWDDISIRNVRNKKYWGIDRSVSIPFKYVEDAAKILKYIFYNRGAEESVYLVICEQQLFYDPGVAYGYWYKQIFRSEIDLSQFDHTGALVTVPTAEEGLAKHLKANENTVYELPLDTADAVSVEMDGVILENKFTALTDNGVSEDPAFYFGNHLVQVDVVSSEMQYLGGGQSVERTKVGNVNADIRATEGYFLKATVAGTVHIRYKFDLSVEYTPASPAINPAAIYRVVVRRIDESNFSDLSEFLLERTAGDGIPGTYLLEGEFDMEVREGDELYLYAFCNVQGVSGDDQLRTLYTVNDETIFEATYDFRYDTTYIPALRPQFIFTELISKMTAGEYAAAESSYFGDLMNFDKVFTSGDGIRGLQNAKLKISFAHFFTFWNTFDDVGFQEQSGKRVLFARKATLTDMADPIDLGEIAKLSVKMDRDFPFNELAIGYPDIKNEEGVLNGKNEFNTTFNFSLGTTKLPRKLEKVSKVKTSCYDIENTRISGFQKATTDNKNDGDVYALHIEDELNGDFYSLDRYENQFLTGVEQKETIFNVHLSPKRCLERNGDFIRSSLFKCDSKVLKFTSADRNDAMEYVNGSSVIIEKANVTIGDLADPYFQPVILTAEVTAPETLQDLLEADPGRGYKFTHEGYEYSLIPLEIGSNPVRRRRQTYQGLSHPDNDLTRLINYYG